MRQYHLQLEQGDAGGYVLLPGDPGRCELIARHLDDARHVVSNREFTTYTGRNALQDNGAIFGAWYKF